MPSPVRLVEIPKANGKKRPLGIPTVADRVAQMIAKLTFEPGVEAIFHSDSYGYRSGKAALDAIGTARQCCFRMNWVIDLDIQDFFGSLDHGLMMKAVKRHSNLPWVHLYIERWLKAPVQMEDGSILDRKAGTPQGGVITPRTQKITSNLSVRWGISDDTISFLDLRHMQLYLYDVCLEPANPSEPSGSTWHERYYVVSTIYPMPSRAWPRSVLFLVVRHIGTSNKRKI